jgi:5-methylcytosine-specific restriction endonuclease McrA
MRVLVLNASWYPIAQCDWQHAFKLIFQGKAKAVEYYDDKWVKTPSEEYQMPAVICLISNSIVPRRRVGYSKQIVFERDKFTCQYCGRKVKQHGPSAAPDTATIDHVVPRAHGGRTTFENTVTACVSCNTKKANKTLASCGLKLLATPKRPGNMNPLAGKIRKVEPEWENYVAGMVTLQ